MTTANMVCMQCGEEEFSFNEVPKYCDWCFPIAMVRIVAAKALGWYPRKQDKYKCLEGL